MTSSKVRWNSAWRNLASIAETCEPLRNLSRSLPTSYAMSLNYRHSLSKYSWLPGTFPRSRRSSTGIRKHIGSSIEKIGRASCRERVCQYVEISVVAVSLKKKQEKKKIKNK